MPLFPFTRLRLVSASLPFSAFRRIRTFESSSTNWIRVRRGRSIEKWIFSAFVSSSSSAEPRNRMYPVSVTVYIVYRISCSGMHILFKSDSPQTHRTDSLRSTPKRRLHTLRVKRVSPVPPSGISKPEAPSSEYVSPLRRVRECGSE